MIISRVIVFFLLLLLAIHAPVWSRANESSPTAVVERVLDEAGIDAALEKFQELTAIGGADFLAAEDEYLSLGERLLAAGKPVAATAILEQVIKSYPETLRAYSLLRDVHNQRGDHETATYYFRTYLDTRAAKILDAAVDSQQNHLATTAKQVINRCVEAMGGEDALRSLKTLKKTSVGFQLGGMFGGPLLLKAPNHVRRPHGDGASATVTDGVAIWSVNPDGWAEQPRGWGWLDSYSITLDMLDYELKGIAYELVGTEGFEGAALYKVRKTLSNGNEMFVYFDIVSGLLVMDSDTRWGSFQGNLFLDHRDVGGVLLPHMRVRFADFLTAPHVEILEYEANLPLADSLFIPPQ